MTTVAEVAEWLSRFPADAIVNDPPESITFAHEGDQHKIEMAFAADCDECDCWH